MSTSTSQKLLSAQSQLDLDSEHFQFVILIDQNVCPKGGYHSKKKKVVNFHNFGPGPPPP